MRIILRLSVILFAVMTSPVRAEVKIKDLTNSYGPAWIDGAAPAISGKRSLLRKRVARSVSFLPSWIPICFLIDSSIDESHANESIRAVATSYAACGIAIEPLTMTIKASYPDDAEAVQSAALAVCPIATVLGTHGAVQLHTRYGDLPKKMCGDPNAKGCSTLCNPTSFSILAEDAPPTASLHESMHANCCGPVCVDRGAGAGVSAGVSLELASLSESHAVHATSGITAGASLEISPAGCAALRAGAASNDGTHQYDSQRIAYYSAERSPERQVDLMSRRSQLRPPATPVPAAPPSITRGSAPEPAPVDEKPRAKKRVVASFPDASLSAAPEDEGDGGEPKQKRKPGRRKRGGALRKSGDITRKSGESDFEVNDLYGGGAGGGEPPGDE